MMTQPLFLDHDSGVDDLLSLLLILTMKEVNLLGVAVTPADCYPLYAVEASRKLIDLMSRSHISVIIVVCAAGVRSSQDARGDL